MRFCSWLLYFYPGQRGALASNVSHLLWYISGASDDSASLQSQRKPIPAPTMVREGVLAVVIVSSKDDMKGIMAMQKDQHLAIQNPRISVVVPTLNEAHNLQYVLPYIPATVHETILVDGNSTDGTVAIAREILPTIRIIHQTGKGKGDALRAGFAACTGDIIVMIDADGSANPKEIPLFVEALLAGNEFAKGSRFIKGGGSNDITFLRRTGNFFLCTLVNVLFRSRFSDLCYGYNAFWNHCLEYINIDCDGFEVETLMSLRARLAKLKIVEVPSFEYRRIHGQSNLRTFRDGWRVLRTIITERTRKGSPLPVPVAPAQEPERELEPATYVVTGQSSLYE